MKILSSLSKKAFCFFVFVCVISGASAQVLNYIMTLPSSPKSKPLRHFDLGLTIGSTGLGIDIASPINDFLGVRAGFSFMPKMHVPVMFPIQVGDDPSTSNEKFVKLAGFLDAFTGMTVDDQVEMIGRPSYSNFKFLVDLFPFKNKQWHITTGFFWGKSEIADACNAMGEMPSLLSVCIYNNIYEKCLNFEPIITWQGKSIRLETDIAERIVEYGRMGVPLGYYKHDICDENGTLLHQKGDLYIVEPDGNGMVKAKIKANSFKPYIGFGYGGLIDPDDNRYTISFDCGVAFWGGVPRVYTHDGTEMTHNINCYEDTKTKACIDVVKCFKVFPVIELKIARKLF